MKRLIVLSCTLLVACSIAFAEPCIEKQEVRCPSRLSSVSFEAVAITAGPYGELWEVKYDGGKSIEVSISYMFSTQGKLSGEFLVSPERLEKIKRIALEKRFFALPKKISPQLVPMHDPDLRLALSIEGKVHKAELYSPGGLRARSDAARFLAVWDEVFSLLPVRPSWSN